MQIAWNKMQELNDNRDDYLEGWIYYKPPIA